MAVRLVPPPDIFRQDEPVTQIALFHSVYGLRPAVLAAADLLRDAGHQVVTPDLYAGQVASSIEEGSALSKRIGWETILRRAREAAGRLAADAVLAGFSMGAGVAGELVAERPHTARLLLLNGTGGTRPGLAVQAHLGELDPMFPPSHVAAWRDSMARAGADIELFTYPGAGHFFTDDGVADYDRAATELTWQRSLRFLAGPVTTAQ
jgi:dienelactone hydrolase